MKSEWTHIDSSGRANMVDVGGKQATQRTALAKGKVTLPREILSHFQNGDIRSPKGPVFQTAIIAGIQGAKKTSDLIPLCHPLPIDKINVRIDIVQDQIIIECEASIFSKTGVEMEALTGVTIAALTIYDMCKSASHDIVISDIKLIEKKGGKSDYSTNGK